MRTPRQWWRSHKERRAREKEAHRIANVVRSGAWTINQAREYLGLPPLPENANERDGAAADAAGSAGDATTSGDGSGGHDLGHPAAEAAPEDWASALRLAGVRADCDTLGRVWYSRVDLECLVNDEIVRQVTNLVRPRVLELLAEDA